MFKHELNIKDFELSEIESIELIGEADTIDITVEDTHMFYSNDIYTHNSGMDTDKVALRSIGESLGNARAADVVISVGRDPEKADENAHAATVGVLKNRNGAAGFYLDAIFDFSKILIEIIPPSAASLGFNTNKKTSKKMEKTPEIQKTKDNDLTIVDLR